MEVDYIKDIHKDYPQLLKQIADPPQGLYWRGPKISGLMLAVVGSRKATSYGLAAIDKIFSGLQGNEVTIVSGLAFGIDAAAHRSAIKYGLKTIAVLPSGVDCPHPVSNTGLAQEILENNGALVSEYGQGTIPHKSNFPARNRIIAGMSQATLVIEAGDRSGSLITARLALESGRDVFAVPGSIFSSVSAGTNRLISLGARIVTTAEDIKEELGIAKVSQKTKITLSDIENRIFERIRIGDSAVDSLVEKLSMPSGDLFALLTNLEIKGIIKKIDNKYVANV